MEEGIVRNISVLIPTKLGHGNELTLSYIKANDDSSMFEKKYIHLSLSFKSVGRLGNLE